MNIAIDEEIERMRFMSGSVASDLVLVEFLYILMRDKLTPGSVEEIMQSLIHRETKGDPIVFTNGWLADHAKDIAVRLIGEVSQ